MLAFFISAVFARPYGQLIPALTVNVLHAGARGLGWAVSATGIGGFGGAMVTAYFGQRSRRSRIWLHGRNDLSAGVIVRARNRPHACVRAARSFMIGIGTMGLLGATNTLIQMLTPDEVRGRALAVYTMIAIGIVPVGSLLDGTIAAAIGLHQMFVLSGTLCALTFLIVWFLHPKIRSA